MKRTTLSVWCVVWLVILLTAVPVQAQKKGKNGTTLAASKTVDVCAVSESTWRYSGEVSVWNEGASATEGLNITDLIQNNAGTGFVNQILALSVTGTSIPAGTTQENATVFSYSVDAPPLPGTIRNTVSVTITNHSGSLGVATGPNPKATFMGTVAPCPVEGCVYSHGYWKNHLAGWPAGYDPGATFFLSSQTWLDYLGYSGGNKYGLLARQYIAARLNVANGSPMPSGAQAIYDAATAWFTANAPSACPTNSACGTQNTWAGILDSYNKGEYPEGPGHCATDEPNP